MIQVVMNSCLNETTPGVSFLNHPVSFYEHVLSAFGYANDKPPVAELLRQYKNLEAGTWMVVSPVYWEATHNDAFLRASNNQLDLSQQEELDLFALLKGFIEKDSDWHLEYVEPYIWLLCANDMKPINAKPPSQTINQSLFSILNSLDNNHAWQRFLTECQMYLSTHSFNENRQTPVNGVWIWGAGVLGVPIHQKVYSQNNELNQLSAFLSKDNRLMSTEESLNRLASDSIILLDDLKERQFHEIKTALKKKKVTWLWNNAVLEQKPASFWSRIWS